MKVSQLSFISTNLNNAKKSPEKQQPSYPILKKQKVEILPHNQSMMQAMLHSRSTTSLPLSKVYFYQIVETSDLFINVEIYSQAFPMSVQIIAKFSYSTMLNLTLAFLRVIQQLYGQFGYFPITADRLLISQQQYCKIDFDTWSKEDSVVETSFGRDRNVHDMFIQLFEILRGKCQLTRKQAAFYSRLYQIDALPQIHDTLKVEINSSRDLTYTSPTHKSKSKPKPKTINEKDVYHFAKLHGSRIQSQISQIPNFIRKKKENMVDVSRKGDNQAFQSLFGGQREREKEGTHKREESGKIISGDPPQLKLSGSTIQTQNHRSLQLLSELNIEMKQSHCDGSPDNYYQGSRTFQASNRFI